MEARRAELHARLDRVLVIDARFPWNGVGNSLVRWLTLLRVGLASGRATFLWLSDFPESGLEQVYACLRIRGARVGIYGVGVTLLTPSTLSLSPHAPPPEQRFDLGAYFVSVGADWRWSAANERRVRDAMARHSAGQAAASPALVRYRCLRHTWACMRPSFEVGGQGRGQGFTVEHEEEKDGALVAWLAARPEV